MRKPLIWAVLLFMFFVTVCGSDDFQSKLQDGDIIFQVSQSSQTRAIQLASKSPWSHMGVIYFKNGEPLVFEAVQPVKFTKLVKWVKRGEGGRFVVKRLKANKKPAFKMRIKMKRIMDKYAGKDYDLYFEWSDDKIYCSELVWKIYKQVFNMEIGQLKKMMDFDLSHPVVKSKLRERFGNSIPLNEPVISPGDIFESGLLKTVATN